MIRAALMLTASAVVYFYGLTIIAEGVQMATNPVCSAPRPKGPPGSCNDCKDALRRIAYTKE